MPTSFGKDLLLFLICDHEFHCFGHWRSKYLRVMNHVAVSAPFFESKEKSR